jgi:hypothetical protein
MFNNVVLDVFIGLVFIFLLYSMLATVIQEIIAQALDMRPRMLLKGLTRMLEDHDMKPGSGMTGPGFFKDVADSGRRFFGPFKNKPFVQQFYNHPTIKYLAESRSSSKPSYIAASNFSQTLIHLLRGSDYDGQGSQMEAIRKFLFETAPEKIAFYEAKADGIIKKEVLDKINAALNAGDNTLANVKTTIDGIVAKLPASVTAGEGFQKIKTSLDRVLNETETKGGDLKTAIGNWYNHINTTEKHISGETLKHIQQLYMDAQSDLDKFRMKLESWFEETMQRVSGWYKRQTQWTLFIIGFGLAVCFNGNVLDMYKVLAKDDTARAQMVQLAEGYSKYAPFIDSLKKQNAAATTAADSTKKNDTVFVVIDTILNKEYNSLKADVQQAQGVMGLGYGGDACVQCDLLESKCDSLKAVYGGKPSAAQQDVLDKMKLAVQDCRAKNKCGFSNNFSWGRSIIGWLLLALAVMLGAPFWFDLLSKLIQLRSSGPKPTASQAGTAPPTGTNPNSPTPLQRVG